MYDHNHPIEHTAVLHLLGAPTVWRRAGAHVGADDVDWDGLLTEAETMSGGESVLVRIAHELWHAVKGVGLWEIPRRLDSRSFERVVEALRMCQGSQYAALAAASLPEPVRLASAS